MSAKLRMTLYFTLMVLLLAALVLVYIVVVNKSAMSDDPASRLVHMVLENADEVEFDNGRFDWDDLDAYKRGVYCCFYDEDGQLLHGARRENWEIELPFLPNVVRTVKTGGEEVYIYDVSVDMAVTDIWIRGMVSAEDHSGLAQTLMIISIALLPLILILSVGGGWLIAWSAFRPMEKTIEAANSINAGEDLSRRLNIRRGPSEMRRLSAAFDRMFERLERAFEAERQFSSDASHELRTPITVILAQCDRAKRKDETKEDFLSSIAVIEEQGEKMSELVNSLLSLSRMSGGAERYPMRRGDLGELVESCCDSFIPCIEKNINLEKDIEAGIETEYNPELISRLVHNLLQNACKYGREGGHIELKLKREAGHAVICVSDDGIGIEKADLDKVWQRFWQADTSRGEDGGSGLGLAMVKEIAQIHGGDVTVDSLIGRGSTFTVRIPIK
ncbi:MAG: HAMP domain-containing histidine kinase [Oscillospiraceae bacterium]|nr:HAMP domain-containing histidine kinase [Oscillospiraceae bacterium]